MPTKIASASFCSATASPACHSGACCLHAVAATPAQLASLDLVRVAVRCTGRGSGLARVGTHIFSTLLILPTGRGSQPGAHISGAGAKRLTFLLFLLTDQNYILAAREARLRALYKSCWLQRQARQLPNDASNVHAVLAPQGSASAAETLSAILVLPVAAAVHCAVLMPATAGHPSHSLGRPLSSAPQLLQQHPGCRRHGPAQALPEIFARLVGVARLRLVQTAFVHFALL